MVKQNSQVAEWKDDRETFPRMKVHTGSNPVLTTKKIIFFWFSKLLGVYLS